MSAVSAAYWLPLYVVLIWLCCPRCRSSSKSAGSARSAERKAKPAAGAGAAASKDSVKAAADSAARKKAMATEEAKLDALVARATDGSAPAAKSSAGSAAVSDDASFQELEAYVQGKTCSLFLACPWSHVRTVAGLGSIDGTELDVDSDTDADVLFEELSKELSDTSATSVCTC